MTMCDVMSTPGPEAMSDVDLTDTSVMVLMEDESLSSPGAPKINVLRKYRDWCILSLSRGTGVEAVEQWLSGHQRECFTPQIRCESRSGSDDSSNDDDEDDPACRKRKRSRVQSPVLVSPLDSAYAQSLVLVARTPSLLANLEELTLTVHCLVQGYLKPRNGIVCCSRLDDRECTTRATCLAFVPSLTAGHISLVVAQNDQVRKGETWIAPRQFRRHLKAGGWPVLGNAMDATPFRSEGLCLSTVSLEFRARGDQKQLVCIPASPRLRTLLEREERFWRQKRGQEDVRVQLFSDEIPKPIEYVNEKATFDGLEFRVTPAVMIPRRSTEAVVDRAVALFEGTRSRTEFPMILDLGTGSGCILVSMLLRLKDRHPYAVGLDVSSEVLEVAEYNIAALGVNESAHTIQGRFADIGRIELDTLFNVIVCNPPYHIRGGRQILDSESHIHEPDMALFADPRDRLCHYQDILKELGEGKLITPGAILVFEISDDIAEAVVRLMTEARLERVVVGIDKGGSVRTAEGIFPNRE
jgi:HemK-like putative methylase